MAGHEEGLEGEPLYENPRTDTGAHLTQSHWVELVVLSALEPDREAPQEAWDTYAHPPQPVGATVPTVGGLATIKAFRASDLVPAAVHPGPDFVAP